MRELVLIKFTPNSYNNPEWASQTLMRNPGLDKYINDKFIDYNGELTRHLKLELSNNSNKLSRPLLDLHVGDGVITKSEMLQSV